MFLGTTCTPFVTQPATPCVPQSVSWWRCPVESSGSAQHFLAGLQPQTHFPFYPPFSLDPWTCNNWCVSVWLLCLEGFSLVESPLEFFQVQFPIAVVVESFHHSFHLWATNVEFFTPCPNVHGRKIHFVNYRSWVRFCLYMIVTFQAMTS